MSGVCDSDDDLVIEIIEYGLSVIDDDEDGKLSMAEIKDWWHDNRMILALATAILVSLSAWACLAARRWANRTSTELELQQQQIESLTVRRQRSYAEPRQRERFGQIAEVLDDALHPSTPAEPTPQGDPPPLAPPTTTPPPATDVSTSAATPLTISNVECRICMDHQKGVRYRPCGHCCSCVTCTVKLLQTNTHQRGAMGFACPICKARVEIVEWREEWRSPVPPSDGEPAAPPPVSRMLTAPQPRLLDALSAPCKDFLHVVAAWPSDAASADARAALEYLNADAAAAAAAAPARIPSERGEPHVVVLDCCAQELHAGVGGEHHTAPACVFSTGVGRLRSASSSSGGRFGVQHGMPGLAPRRAELAIAGDIDPRLHTVRPTFDERGSFVGESGHLERIWLRALQQLQLGEQVNQCRVILSEPPGPINAHERERKVQMMFEALGVRSLLLVSHAALVLLGSGVVLGESVVTGVVLHSGDGLAYAAVVHEGHELRHTCVPCAWDAASHRMRRGTNLEPLEPHALLTDALAAAISRVRDVDVTHALLRNLIVVLSGDELTDELQAPIETWSQSYVEAMLSTENGLAALERWSAHLPTRRPARVVLPVQQRGCLAWVGGSLLATLPTHADAAAEDVFNGNPWNVAASPFITSAEYSHHGTGVHRKCFI